MPDRLSARHEAAIVVASVVAFVVIASFKALHQPYPFFDDVAFLELGARAHVAGGPGALLADLFAGRWLEDNRHPLYVAMLAVFARTELDFHRDARILAVGLGVLGLVSCWWTARRHFGRSPAALLAVMLAGNGALVWTASREGTDALLVAFYAQAVAAMLDAGTDTSKSWRPWVAAGAWSGLAYLTKGPGIFLPICLALTLLSRDRARALLNGRAWLFGATFVGVASPLLWRNIVLFRSPLHNANGRFLWIDRLPDFAEVTAPHAFDRLPRGAGEYFARVTPGAVAWRVGMGLAETIFHLGDSLALVAPRPGGVLHVVWVVLGVLAAIAGAWLVWRGPRGFLRTFMVVQCVWWFLFLWFFNASGGASRYFLPLTLTALAPTLAASFVARFGHASTVVSSRPVAALGGAVVFAIASTLVLDTSPTRPPAGFLEVQDWIVRHVQDGEVYAVDARSHLQPRWLSLGTRQLTVSNSWQNKPVPTDEMLKYLCDEHVRYLLLDASSETGAVDAGDVTARYFFYDKVPLGKDGSLPVEGFPAGMKAVYVGAQSPRRWLVLETGCPLAAR